MRKMIFRALVIYLALVAVSVFTTAVFASSEGLDQSGGDTDRITGESHSLRSPQSSTASFAAPSLATASGSSAYSSGISFITDVIEGDKMLLSTGEWVQLIGVDAPEHIHQAYAKEATAFIKKIKDRKKVRLEYYVEAKDRYNRTLAYVYQVNDELLLIAEIAKQGYSRAYAVLPLKHMGELKKYEREDGGEKLWLYKLTKGNDENEGMMAEIRSLTEDQKKSVSKYITELKHPGSENGKENDVSYGKSQEILYSGLSKKTDEDLKKEEREKKEKEAEAKARAKRAAAAKLENVLKQLTAAQQVIFREVKMYAEAGERCIDISYMHNSYTESQEDKIKNNQARESFRKELEILKKKGFIIEKPNVNGTTCLEALK